MAVMGLLLTTTAASLPLHCTVLLYCAGDMILRTYFTNYFTHIYFTTIFFTLSSQKDIDKKDGK